MSNETDPDPEDQDLQLTPSQRLLFHGAVENNVESIRDGLKNGAHVDTLNAADETPLSLAACQGNRRAVRAFLAANADPNNQGHPTRHDPTNAIYRPSPFEEAAFRGYTDIIEDMIGHKIGSSIVTLATEGAARNNYCETIALIARNWDEMFPNLRFGVAPHSTNFVSSAVEGALRNDRVDVLDTLFKIRPADMASYRSWALLRSATPVQM